MSKRVFNHPPETGTGKKYWRSIGQLSETPEFRGWLEREFPQGAAEFESSDVSRRNFLQLMGASMALAGLSFAGCRRPEKHLVPFTRGADWAIPGKTLFFASAMPSRNGASPLVIATHDGRPTKIEGNPLHPLSKGASDLFAQASILDLYDPDRSRTFWNIFAKDRKESTSAGFEKAIDELIKGAADGTGLAFLLEESNSPTRERLRTEMEKKFPKAVWAVYEPLASEAGNLYGEGVAAVFHLDKANVIMSLDCDFLGTEATGDVCRQFAVRRKPDGAAKMNRLYAVENRFTLTGGMADHRLRLPVSQVGAFAIAVAKEIGASTNDAALAALIKDLPQDTAKFQEKWLKESVADLVANKGKSLVVVGARQPAALHALVAGINQALGNLGTTMAGRKFSGKPTASIAQLAKAMADGQLKSLVIVGGNPAYNAPADLEWAKIQAAFRDEKKGTVIRLAHHEDETTKLSSWHAPLAHYLETWGDARAIDGSYLSVQPMILPLYGGWSENDLLAKFAGRAKPVGPELVQDTFLEIAKPADITTAWAKFLHDGFLEKSATGLEPLALAATVSTADFKAPVLDGNTFEVVLVADAKVDDGRYANNGWLQELPDPVTKISWDNAAQISPKSAKDLKVENGDRIEITFQNRSLNIPVFIVPGHADKSLSIALGYGRNFEGRVGGKGVGFDAYPLRTTAQPYFLVGATVKVTGKSYPLVVTQEHGSLEGRGADLLREGTLEQYKAEPDFAKAMGLDAHAEWKEKNGQKTEVVNRSLYSNPPLNDIHQWGMTVDLSTCTGCSACMVACQSENNIPIVGKEQVGMGREMHWIRTDRYFASENDDTTEPEMIYEPMLCQHCENAPCETVCPVNATVHSEDGLNVMAYNRCIGTRYCANNCPFKVRRFNFFDFNQRKIEDGGLHKWNLIAPKGTEETIKMQKNPNVTVWMRGVMEKCTFCVQRIQEAKIATKVSARDSDKVRIPADSFTVACAQACPSDAITFGDISNTESSVSKIRTASRGYRLLEYLNVSARVWYLARIRNPNPHMPDAGKVGAHSRPSHHGGDHHKTDSHHPGGGA